MSLYFAQRQTDSKVEDNISTSKFPGLLWKFYSGHDFTYERVRHFDSNFLGVGTSALRVLVNNEEDGQVTGALGGKSKIYLPTTILYIYLIST